MSLLLPELQRQLRAAATRRRLDVTEKPPRASRRRLVSVALVALAAAGAIVLLLASGIGGSPSSSAAQALERAAEAAQRGLAAPSLAPGEYWYTRSIHAETTGLDLYGRPALIQSRQVLESWESTDGSGRERQITDGPPRLFGTPAEQARFDGRRSRAPKPAPRDEPVPSSGGFRSRLGLLTYAQVLALPTQPDAMLERIREAALRSQRLFMRTAPGSPFAQQSLTEFELGAVEGALTDLPLTPGSRAAVYRAMKDITGVSYLPSVRDPLGRYGAALTSQASIAGFIDGEGTLAKPRRVMNELIFDPRTGALLAQQSVLDQAIPSLGLPAGYPIQYTAYAASGNVASTHERFVAHAGGETLAPAPSGPNCSTAGSAPAQLISAPIPNAFLHKFAVLRRPPTDQDHLPASTTSGRFPVPLDVSSILENSVRLLRTTPNGARDYMLIGYLRVAPALPAPHCLPGLTRAQYEHQLEQRRAQLKTPPQPVLCVLETPGRLAFGCLSPAELDSIDYETSDYGQPPATVTGILPDGVTQVQAIYPNGRRITAPIEHNLLIYQVNLPAPSATPHEVLWLDSQGHTIRRLTTP